MKYFFYGAAFAVITYVLPDEILYILFFGCAIGVGWWFYDKINYIADRKS